MYKTETVREIKAEGEEKEREKESKGEGEGGVYYKQKIFQLQTGLELAHFITFNHCLSCTVQIQKHVTLFSTISTEFTASQRSSAVKDRP